MDDRRDRLGVGVRVGLDRERCRGDTWGGSLLAFRITADAEHDASAVEKAKEKGIEEPPAGYVWAPLDRRGDVSRDGLIVREAKDKAGEDRAYILLKIDPRT